MRISEHLMQDPDFCRNLRTDLDIIHQETAAGTLAACGITRNGITFIRKADCGIGGFIFDLLKLFGRIDTSYLAFKDLKNRLKRIDEDAVAKKVDLLKKTLDDLNQQHFRLTESVTSLQLKFNEDTVNFDQRKKEIQDLLTLSQSNLESVGHQINTKKEEISVLEKNERDIQTRIKALDQAKDLELKLQIKTASCKRLQQQLFCLVSQLECIHKSFEESIAATKLGVAGWLAQANIMIKDVKEELSINLSKICKSQKVYGTEDFAHQELAKELDKLDKSIAHINNNQSYVDFFTALDAIISIGFPCSYLGTEYTLTPDNLLPIHLAIIGDLKNMAELSFRRDQLMGLKKHV